jgi:hypothetical protein
MTSRQPGAKMLTLEDSGSIILDPLANHHLAANIHKVKHAPNRVAGCEVCLFLFAPPDPFQGVQRRGFRGSKKIELDNPFQVFVGLLRAQVSIGISEWRPLGFHRYKSNRGLKRKKDFSYDSTLELFLPRQGRAPARPAAILRTPLRLPLSTIRGLDLT